MATISVTKCHGTGNDFVLLDAREMPPMAYDRLARLVCRRRYSLGADGLLVIQKARVAGADAAMRIFNADGSEAENCGNGIRCVARYLYDRGSKHDELRIETLAGVSQTAIADWEGVGAVSVAMGEPRFCGAAPAGLLEQRLQMDGETIAAYGVCVGNPHVVAFVKDEPARYDLARAAAVIGAWGLAGGEPNCELAQPSASGIQMRVHERGVGETWACGSGACAVAAAAIASSRAASPVTIASAGGRVRVVWPGPGKPAVLTGDAQLVYRTQLDIPDDIASPLDAVSPR